MAEFRLGLQVLEENRILMITHEGTRSGHGRLQAARKLCNTPVQKLFTCCDKMNGTIPHSAFLW